MVKEKKKGFRFSSSSSARDGSSASAHLRQASEVPVALPYVDIRLGQTSLDFLLYVTPTCAEGVEEKRTKGPSPSFVI